MSQKRALTQALIERSICEGKNYAFIWDLKQDGFGVKIEPSGHKSYVFRYRFEGKERRRVFASCGKITLDQARELANEYAYKVSRGVDPFVKDESKTFYMVASEYIAIRKDGKNREKKINLSTYKIWKHQVDKFLKDSAIGNKPLTKITINDGAAFMESLHEIPIQANRVRSLLTLIFTYSIKKGYREIGTNIWDYVDKYPENPKRPRLKEDDDAEKDQPILFLKYMLGAENGTIKDKRGGRIDLSWVYIIMALYFSGARAGDLYDLKISEIDFDNSLIRRTKSKTGAKDIPISKPLENILRKAIARIHREDDNNYVFAGKEGKGFRKSHSGKQWQNLRTVTGITAPPYALRRYFALIAKRDQEERGGSLKMASKLMGHADEKMTAMYAGEDKDLLEKERRILVSESEEVGKKLEKNYKTP